jgi:membrane protease YdiL (CAAX protease family)
VLYLALTPIQEFVARYCLQAPLQAFLPGTVLQRRLLSILISNLLFAGAHMHISGAFALVAFIPGIFWGWIFARTNSLFAAATSHFLIGGAGIFPVRDRRICHRADRIGHLAGDAGAIAAHK